MGMDFRNVLTRATPESYVDREAILPASPAVQVWQSAQVVDWYYRTDPTHPRPEQTMLVDDGERSGQAVARVGSGALSGNEIAWIASARGRRVVEQPDEAKNQTPSTIGQLIRAGAGQLKM